MNPTTLDPVARQFILDAASREAAWMILAFGAVAVALLFFVLWLRQVHDRYEENVTRRVERALEADKPKYFESRRAA